MIFARTHLLWVLVALHWTPSVLQAAETPAPSKQGDLHLLTLGDWGIDAPARTEVGAEMGKFATKNGNHPSAVLLLGDNFYVKLTGADDPRFKTFFEDTYSAKQLNIPFYAVMGNHDYSTGDLPFEMEYAKKNDLA